MRPGFHEREENLHIHNIDWQRANPANEDEQRREAEGALRLLILNAMTGVTVEKGTPGEDAGVIFTAKHSQIKGDQSDLIMFRDNRPFLAIQVTTGMSKANRDQKSQELLDNLYPMIRNSIIPRVLVAMDWGETQKLLMDQDPDKHPALLKQFFKGATNSLLLGQRDTITTDPLKKRIGKEALEFIIEQERQIASKQGRETIH